MNGTEWVRLAGILALCALPLMVKLDARDATYHMETLSLVSSQETWQRQHGGERDAWLVPTWNGRARLNKPPLLVWMNFLAWHDLAPSRDSADKLVMRARMLGVSFILLGLAATYGMGRMVGGPGLAWRGALATGTMFFLVRQGRVASYDTHLFGWAAMTVCLGWAAMGQKRPGWPVRSCAWTLAVLSGLSLGAAVLTKGPIALLFTCVPLGVGCFMFDRRGSNLRILLLVLVTGAVAALPWYLYILKVFPEAGRIIGAEYRTTGLRKHSPFYYLILPGLVFPWAFALLGGVGLAFVRDRVRFERRGWIPLVWLLSIVLVLSFPHAKRMRYIFPLFPAVGLLVGQWWLLVADPEKAARLGSRWTTFLKKGHGVALLIGSAGIGLFPLLQPLLLDLGLLDAPELPGADWRIGILLGAVFSVLAVRCHRLLNLRADGGAAAFALTGLWMGLLATYLFNYYALSYHGVYAERGAAQQVADLCGESDLAYLVLGAGADRELDQKFLFYARRIIPPIAPKELPARLAGDKPLAVIARRSEDQEAILAGVGMKGVLDFTDGRQRRRLYLQESLAPPGPPI